MARLILSMLFLLLTAQSAVAANFFWPAVNTRLICGVGDLLKFDGITAACTSGSISTGFLRIGDGTYSATTGFIQTDANALLAVVHGTAAAPITDTTNASMVLHRWDSTGGRVLWAVHDLTGTHSSLPVTIQASMLDYGNITQERIALVGQAWYKSTTVRADTNPLIGIVGVALIPAASTGDSSLVGVQAEVDDAIRAAPSTYPANKAKVGLKVLGAGSNNMTAGIVIESQQAATNSGYFNNMVMTSLKQTGVLLKPISNYNCTTAGSATCAGYSGSVSLASATATALVTGNYWSLTTNHASHSAVGYRVDFANAVDGATIVGFYADNTTGNATNAYGVNINGTWKTGINLPGTYTTGIDLTSATITSAALKAATTGVLNQVMLTRNSGVFDTMILDAQPATGPYDIGIASKLTADVGASKWGMYGVAALIESTVANTLLRNNAVAIYGQGMAKAAGAYVWGGNFLAGATSGNSAGTVVQGVEVDVRNDSGADMASLGGTTILGVNISLGGAHKGTAAIFLSKEAGSSGFLYGMFVGNQAIATDGTILSVPSTQTVAIGLDMQGTYTNSVIRYPSTFTGGGNRVLCVNNSGESFRGASDTAC